ncbi:hypothetical protein [Allobranchiibius sp. CTAmp26]|uniref:hypothetical protein n=1 Tax=Allobranchiibius sp. CTAmp26 TaxID=2815214 RepID=UPI001AA1ADC5|nr:hypothetical protein [Allobranchiibius sp. CTAmp26]MBO1756158.1 hypothetical protein [Allobranchiibius sp. CTAmp26]
MLWLVGALFLCLVLAGVVVGLVAVPARREGRQVLTERGEQMFTSVTERGRDKRAKTDDPTPEEHSGNDAPPARSAS